MLDKQTKPVLKLIFSALIPVMLLFSLFTQCNSVDPGEIVEIPDPEFHSALVESGVDQNGDGHISHTEAQSVISLAVGPSSVSDLTGIEAFINLDSLRLTLSPLGSFDISENSMLRYLECTGVELTTLDLSGNPVLEYLDCSGGAAMSNRLTRLDISENPALTLLPQRGHR